MACTGARLIAIIVLFVAVVLSSVSIILPAWSTSSITREMSKANFAAGVWSYCTNLNLDAGNNNNNSSSVTNVSSLVTFDHCYFFHTSREYELLDIVSEDEQLMGLSSMHLGSGNFRPMKRPHSISDAAALVTFVCTLNTSSSDGQEERKREREGDRSPSYWPRLLSSASLVGSAHLPTRVQAFTSTPPLLLSTTPQHKRHMSEKLFTPVTLGGKNPITLQHRISMAPLTRLRAGAAGVQPDIAAKYYAQRSTEGGLIIAEATNISPTGRGYFGSPGIFNQEQIDAWKVVNDAVHAKGGKIFLQLWHTGRVGHPKNQPDGVLPVSSSANMPITGQGRIPTPDGREAFVAPRALETEEIPLIFQDYKTASENAISAGFDGVELHAANGYLVEQFLQDGINDRTDQYGGSVENRARFLFGALEAILESLDSSKVGIRLSPYGASFGQFESDVFGTYSYVLNKLNDYDLAYAHIIEPRSFHYDNPNAPKDGTARQFRPVYKGVLMTASGYDRESSIKVVEDGDADMVAIGRYFISNPDVVKRFQLNANVHPYDGATFYLEGELGYTDQPFLEEEEELAATAEKP